MAGNDANTILLVHFDGTDGSTTFSDVCSNPKTLTAVGDAQIDTAQSKFGGASLILDGTGDRVEVSDSSDWDFGTGDWTFDGWFMFNAVQSNMTLFDWGGFTAGIRLFFTPSSLQIFLANSSTTRSWSPSTGQWYHIALVRNGNAVKLFIDGVQQGADFSASGKSFTTLASFRIGMSTTSTAQRWNGWIDEFRVSNVARWTVDFTPPTGAYSAGEFVSADAGSFSETGVAALFSAKQLSSTGAFSETGNAAPLKTSLASGAGSYALSGVNVSFVVGTFVTASVGSFTFTGNAATFKILLPLAAASYSLTGNAASFKPSLAAASGVFTYTPGDIVSMLNAVMEAGEYSISGGSTIAMLGLPAIVGEYVIVPVDADFLTTMELWTAQVSDSESWASQSSGGEIWTPQDRTSEGWTKH